MLKNIKLPFVSRAAYEQLKQQLQDVCYERGCYKTQLDRLTHVEKRFDIAVNENLELRRKLNRQQDFESELNLLREDFILKNRVIRATARLLEEQDTEWLYQILDADDDNDS